MNFNEMIKHYIDDDDDLTAKRAAMVKVKELLEPFGEYFAVVHGASVTSTTGPGIIKDLRNTLINYEKSIGSDPHEDWSNDDKYDC